MNREPFPTPFAGAYYPIYGDPVKDQYFPPTDTTPFDKVSALFIAFAHAYPIDPANLDKGAVVDLERGQSDEANRLNRVTYYARRANPAIKIILSLGWEHNDWTYISHDYTSGQNQFAASVLTILRFFQLDGFDIDDESIGDDPTNCSSPSGCITQASFNGVVQNLRRALDSASQTDHKPYYLTIAPAVSTGHVTKDNAANFDLINPQSYASSFPDDFKTIVTDPKRLSWGINTESVNYPDPTKYAKLAGIFDWSISADYYRYNFAYTQKIAKDVGYRP